MSTNTAEGKEIFPHEPSSTDEKVDALIEVVERQSEAIEELQKESERKDERIAELEEKLSEQQSESAKDRAEIKQRVTALEAEDEEPDSEPETPTPEAEETTIQEPETALEDVVQLPEHMAEDSLSANQQRARFVAKDIHEYSRSVPAGRVIKSSELRRVLTAAEDGRVHTETVSRVIRFLTDLGGEDVATKETQAGERVVVFTEEIVKRIVAYHNTNHTVVSGTEVRG